MHIIDSHTHVSFSPWRGEEPQSPEEILGEFEKFRGRGVRKVFASAIDGLIRDHGPVHASANDKLARLAGESGGFIGGFCTVDPDEGEKAADELSRAVGELGMKGLKLHPWLQGFSTTNPGLLPVLARAEKLGVPVLFHDGTPPYSTPLQIGRLGGLFPGLKIILGHSGLKDLWQNSLTAALNCPGVYLCTCASPFLAVLRLVEEAGADRVLFGSDAGFGNPGYLDYNLEKIMRLPVPDGDREKILWRTAADIIDCG